MTITARSISGTVRQARHGLFSTAEAARALGITDPSLRRLVADGLVPEPSTLMPGGRRRYYRSDEVERFRDLITADGTDKPSAPK